MPKNLMIGLAILPALALLSACQQSAGYNEARAQCEAAATEAMEAADPDADQRATWREHYVSGCMTGKGFSE